MAVQQFRILVTLGAVLPLGFLAFLRHELVDRERLRLLRASQESIDNLKRLQTQFVQSEKLASIGQLVGGAAHEINNPLTAILGYSELLADDPSVGEKTRSLAEKIREQARRTKTLVNNLLSFARQVPSEQRSPRRYQRDRQHLRAVPPLRSSRQKYPHRSANRRGHSRKFART